MCNCWCTSLPSFFPFSPPSTCNHRGTILFHSPIFKCWTLWVRNIWPQNFAKYCFRKELCQTRGQSLQLSALWRPQETVPWGERCVWNRRRKDLSKSWKHHAYGESTIPIFLGKQAIIGFPDCFPASVALQAHSPLQKSDLKMEHLSFYLFVIYLLMPITLAGCLSFFRAFWTQSCPMCSTIHRFNEDWLLISWQSHRLFSSFWWLSCSVSCLFIFWIFHWRICISWWLCCSSFIIILISIIQSVFSCGRFF